MTSHSIFHIFCIFVQGIQGVQGEVGEKGTKGEKVKYQCNDIVLNSQTAVKYFTD